MMASLGPSPRSPSARSSRVSCSRIEAYPSGLGDGSLTGIVSSPGATLRRQQIQAESPRDRDEPRQHRPRGIESLEVDEGPDERVLCEVFGVGGSNQSPAEPKNGP